MLGCNLGNRVEKRLQHQIIESADLKTFEHYAFVGIHRIPATALLLHVCDVLH